MKHNVVVPQAGESINEAFIGTWLKKTGDFVKKDEVLVDLETQKTSFELQAEVSGVLEVLFPDSQTKVKPGDVIAIIDDAASSQPESATPSPKSTPQTSQTSQTPQTKPISSGAQNSTPSEILLSPSARKIVTERNIDPQTISGSGKAGRIMKEDVLLIPATSPKPALVQPSSASLSASSSNSAYSIDETRGERRVAASRIRKTIAQNLVTAQHTAAILTTFNEIDMSALLEFRKKNKDAFKAKHGASLGVVSLFAKAAVKALQAYPLVNATFTGDEIIYRDFVDLSIAVSTEQGLVVPVLRDVDQMTLADFEKKLTEFSEKAKAKKLSIPEMTGGTFTISNGGVFGSLLSTPILNMPQSAILGLHKTQERAVVVGGQIVIRPMMYAALSYDHRIIDGKEAVGFLVKIKEGIENLDSILNPADF